MKSYKSKLVCRVLVAMFALSSAASFVTSSDAFARAGRGRSIGRPSSGGGFGGYRRSTPPPSSQPGPSYNGGNRPNASPNYAPTSPAPSVAPPPAAPSSSRGGFFRGLAGGLAGGFLGSMLFSSLGHGNGFGGGYGGGSGGFGFFELILIAGLAYLGYRWWKSRQTTVAGAAGVAAGGALGNPGPTSLDRGPTFKTETHPHTQDTGRDPSAHVDAGDVRFPAWLPENGAAFTGAPTFDKDQASDLFFRVQGAWTRRDLKPVLSILGPDLERALNDDLQDLLRKGEMNRLENISVRSVETLSSWTEGSTHFATVRFVANLLDYTVDEKTGRVVQGSDTEPVKFQEDWTFSRSASDANWRVAAIEQVN